MLDLQLLRKNPIHVASLLKRRGFVLDVPYFEALESKRKELQVATESLKSERNKISKRIGVAKSKGASTSSLLGKVGQIGDSLDTNEESLRLIQGELDQFFLGLPNVPEDKVPDGVHESGNVEVRKWGEIPRFSFEPRDHVDLGGSTNGIDFEAGAMLSGSRFSVLRGNTARMYRALGQFMLDRHTRRNGYTEIHVPFLVNEETMIGTGQLPKFKEDLFAISNGDYFLIPTAEVPVTNLARDTIFNADQLPMRLACLSSCFRSEAGSYGKDTRGLIRQHQFEKVELVQFVKPESSFFQLEELMAHAESILRELELPYRVVTLCAGDLGFSASQTFDLEVWLPGQKCYREISSCSNFRDFQARRIGARWRNPQTNKTELIHTINGSGLAIGRTLVAILENYQDVEGSVAIPDSLRPYMGEATHL
jgi:seryl-tRNA synthetase